MRLRYVRRRYLPGGMDGTIIREGNPHYGPRMRLHSRTGYNLTILPCGNIIGINDDSGQFADYQIMEFTSAGVGQVRIRGVYSNLYLALNDEGRLYGEVGFNDPRDEATVFLEDYYQGYNTYLSRKYRDRHWYVGIKKSGRPKPAHRTAFGQKAIQFLPLRVP